MAEMIQAPVGMLPIAVLDIPSFQSFPVVGILLFGLFTLTAWATIASAVWMQSQDRDLGIAKIDLWYLAIGLTLAVLIFGVMQAGVLVIPLVLVALAAEMFFFVKQRDKPVPPASRILTKQAIANARAYFKARQAKNRQEAADKKAAAGPPKSILQRLSGLSAAIGRKKPPPKPAAPTGPHFALLKKDGSPAVNTAAEEEGEGGNLSENIVNVRKMLIDAMQRGATDLHFEPVENNGYHVRLRLDGVLQDS